MLSVNQKTEYKPSIQGRAWDKFQLLIKQRRIKIMDWFTVDRMFLNFLRETLYALCKCHTKLPLLDSSSVDDKIVEKTTSLWSLHISPFKVFLFVAIS